MEAEEGTFQQKLWVATEGQWGDSKEEKRIVSHCLEMVGSCQALGYGVHHLYLALTLQGLSIYDCLSHMWKPRPGVTGICLRSYSSCMTESGFEPKPF